MSEATRTCAVNDWKNLHRYWLGSIGPSRKPRDHAGGPLALNCTRIASRNSLIHCQIRDHEFTLLMPLFEAILVTAFLTCLIGKVHFPQTSGIADQFHFLARGSRQYLHKGQDLVATLPKAGGKSIFRPLCSVTTGFSIAKLRANRSWLPSQCGIFPGLGLC